MFLGFIEAVPGRLATLDALPADASLDQRFEIVTSVIPIAEVAFAQPERDRQSLDSDAIDALSTRYGWTDRRFAWSMSNRSALGGRETRCEAASQPGEV